jgi:succinyl-CoA synthetase alpha subunit
MIADMETTTYHPDMGKPKTTNTAIATAVSVRLRNLGARMTIAGGRRVITSELIDALITVGEAHESELIALLTQGADDDD